MHIPTRLGALILVAEAIVLSATSRAIEQDSHIRTTVAAGEMIVAAVRSYEHDHGRFPIRLTELVPRYLVDIPEPEYGIGSWVYSASHDREARGRDDPAAIELSLGTGRPQRPNTTMRSNAPTLAVALDPRDPTLRFQRDTTGCWRLPELPTCW